MRWSLQATTSWSLRDFTAHDKQNMNVERARSTAMTQNENAQLSPGNNPKNPSLGSWLWEKNPGPLQL